jgi:3'-phosphoadenosine 5'-phosphosulfate sulfotransferase (PAPS reductase)/FAD synthetase
MRVLAFSGGKDSMACLHLMRSDLACAIYVDTGKSYPETAELVRYASKLIPMITVRANRDEQNDREGIPSEVVPVDWTRIGQMLTTKKQTMIQSYLGCCFENIALPLLLKAKEIGATEIVYGQRNDEAHKSTSRNGDVVEGIVRLQPIEDWSSDQVLAYLATKMDVPAHYALKHSSLDCYDCTAFRKDSHDRVSFTAERYPEMHAEYVERLALLNQAIASAMEY